MTQTIDENTILRLNKNLLKRYEHNLKDGTMILYNLESDEIWFGNASSKDLIDLIDGEKSITTIYRELLPQYNYDDIESVIESFNLVIEDLFNKNFIEIL